MPTVQTVLVAGTEDAITAAVASLDGSYRCKTASSVEDAMAMIDNNLAVIACSVRFDESRMFEFVELVRGHQVGRTVPIVCFRSLDRPLNSRLHDAIEQATAVFPRVTFVDLYAIQRAAGKEAALAAFRRTIASSTEAA